MKNLIIILTLLFSNLVLAEKSTICSGVGNAYSETVAIDRARDSMEVEKCSTEFALKHCKVGANRLIKTSTTTIGGYCQEYPQTCYVDFKIECEK